MHKKVILSARADDDEKHPFNIVLVYTNSPIIVSVTAVCGSRENTAGCI